MPCPFLPMKVIIGPTFTRLGFHKWISWMIRPMTLSSCEKWKFCHLTYKCYGKINSFVDCEVMDKGKLFSTDGSIDIGELHNLIQLCSRKTMMEGMCFHGLAIQTGLLSDTLTCNILINFYSKCGYVNLARSIFDRMPERTIVSWNTMIAAHTHQGDDTKAIKLFLHMLQEGTTPSEFTISSILCACASICAVVESRQLHALALKIDFTSNVFVGTALLDVYAKCNMITEAQLVFDSMPKKSPVTWSSMAAGYVQNDLHELAINFFRQSQRVGMELTQFTLSAVLSACASLAAIVEGTQLHGVLVRTGFVSNIFVATSLINFYSKCGWIDDAYLVFKNMEEKNVVLWNAMIAGFSRHARPYEVLILFEKMQQQGMHPNEITYVSLLSVCSHVGLVEIGRYYFDRMLGDKVVRPNVFHYSCMVDVLGRAGLVNEACKLIERMQFKPTSSMWGSLLNACRKYGNVKLAKIAADHLFELEPDNAGNHVLLSNTYAASKQWGEVATARKLLKDSGAKKETGRSWIEVKGKYHVFIVGENDHPRINEIYAKVGDLLNEMKKLAYKAEIQYDLHDVGAEEKEELLKHHSERLALAFGLIMLPSVMPIRIYKNLRICGDCHSFMKLASRITNREIIARDTNRFHHFRAGSCSCGDFW